MATHDSPFDNPAHRIDGVSNRSEENSRNKLLTAEAIHGMVGKSGGGYSAILSQNDSDLLTWNNNILTVNHGIANSDSFIFVRNTTTGEEHNLRVFDIRHNSFKMDCVSIFDKLDLQDAIFKVYIFPITSTLNLDGKLHLNIGTASTSDYIWAGNKLIIPHNSGSSTIFSRFYDEVTLEELVPAVGLSNTNEIVLDFENIKTVNNMISTLKFDEANMFDKEFVLGTDADGIVHNGTTLEVAHALGNVDTICYLYDIIANDWIVVKVTSVDGNNSVVDLESLRTSLDGRKLRLTVVQDIADDDNTYKINFDHTDLTGGILSVTHNLNTRYGVIKFRNTVTGELLIPRMTAITDNSFDFDFNEIAIDTDLCELFMVV